MTRRCSALAIGAVLGLLLPGFAGAQPATPSTPALAPTIHLAQFDGPEFDGPYGGMQGGPYGMEGPGMGPPPGYGGYPGYRRGRGGQERGYAGPTRHLSYHGFQFQLADTQPSPNDEAAIEHQIDIVDSVGLSVSNRGFFRRFPIKLVNGMSGGHYFGGSSVSLGNLTAGDNRPVLLHEYMHVLHKNRLPGGFRNADIRRFYFDAQSRGLYEQGSYMMTNPPEFFAVTASCYLWGTTAREPYNRETIRQRQPEYYAYLERLFGPPHAAGVARAITGRASARFTPTAGVFASAF